MGRFVCVAKTSEIGDQSVKCVDIAGKTVAIFNLGGEFYALDDLCSHEDAPLSEGFIEGEEVECPWHAARFNIKTGEALCPPAYEGVQTYPLRIEGDTIELKLDD